MSKTLWVVVLAALFMTLAACDAIRYPGDNRDDEYRQEIPPGAPGPAPPSAPVDDPYGTGDTDTDTPVNGAGGDDGAGADQDTPDDAGSGDAASPDDGDASDPAVTDPADTDTPDNGDSPASPGDTADNGIDTPVQPQDPEPEPEPVVVFTYTEPGQLVAGSGTGTTETETVFSPDMRFPIKSAPSFLQSQVWGFGGGMVGGDQCDARNYEYPWHDNFCETRSSNRNSPYCPVSKIHQGQDIRVGTAEGCNQMRRTNAAERALYEVVATEDGIISSIGTYTVTLRAGPRIYKYMHMNMRALQVSQGDTVTKGQTLGYVSNDFGGTPTTFHLHFETLQNTSDAGWVHVPPYTSLVAAYEAREGGIGEAREPNIAVASAGTTPAIGPEVPVITEGFVMPEPELED